MFIFLRDFFAISGGRKTAARLLQGTQGVPTTDILVRHPSICLTKAARLPKDSRKNAAKRTTIAEIRTMAARMYDVSLKCLATVLQILHDHLVTALRVT